MLKGDRRPQFYADFQSLKAAQEGAETLVSSKMGLNSNRGAMGAMGANTSKLNLAPGNKRQHRAQFSISENPPSSP